MSHGTVHDNFPRAIPGVGMLELKIHNDPDRVRRRKFYDAGCKYKRAANPRWLPRYMPYINTSEGPKATRNQRLPNSSRTTT